MKDNYGFCETMNVTKVDEFTNTFNDFELSCTGTDQSENALLVKVIPICPFLFICPFV